MLLVGIAGCAPVAAPRPTPEAVPAERPAAGPVEQPAEMAPQRPPLSPAEAAEVAELLRRAEQAIEDDHLTYPSEGSALALYDRVRLLDPDNDSARRGLERIVERYLELALTAAEQRRFSDARAMLDRARLVDPEHAGIAPTRAQVALLAEAERQVIDLDGQRLKARDPALRETLRAAGVASRGDGCRAQITARNDAEGRWIYQQMSTPGAARIQAQLNLGAPPRIEVLCFRK